VPAPTSSNPPSSVQLIWATLLAVTIAAVVLVTAVLPAEYGIDPTGIGQVLGIYRPSAIAEANAAAGVDAEPAQAALADGAPATSTALRPSATPYRSDEMTLTLQSGEGGEIKAAMQPGERLVFSWTSTGAGVDVDMHSEFVGARAGESRSYSKGELQTGGHGAFEAPAAGNHGWFWQNLTDDPVTITVKVSGFYEKLFKP